MIPDRANRLNPAGVAAIPVVTSSEPPPVPPPPSGRQPRDRRRGIVIVPESDIERLVRLEPGQRIAGMRDDPLRQAFLVLIEGDGLPEVHEMCDPPYVHQSRWAAPPLPATDLVIWAKPFPALQVHALVLRQLRTNADLDPPPGTPWAAIDAIARRHAPHEHRVRIDDTGSVYRAGSVRKGSENAHVALCHPCGDGHHNQRDARWPCPDYLAAASCVVTGLEAPS